MISKAKRLWLTMGGGNYLLLNILPFTIGVKHNQETKIGISTYNQSFNIQAIKYL